MFKIKFLIAGLVIIVLFGISNNKVSAWFPCEVDPVCGGNYDGCNDPGAICVRSRCQCPNPLPTPTPRPRPTATQPPPPPPPPPPSCSASFSPSSSVINVGSSQPFILNVNPSNGAVSNVNFSSSNSGIVSVFPLSDSSLPYQTLASGVAIGGPVVISGSVVMSGAVRCSANASVSVVAPGAWWQVTDADVITNGDIISPIPASCTLPLCSPVFGIEGSGGSPGVPLFAGNYDFNAGAGLGTVSAAGWLSQATYSALTTYNYAFFERLVPGDTVRNTIVGGVIAPNYLKNQGVISPDGYYWYFKTGDLTLQGEPTLGGGKVILFVDGNLNIDGTIDITQGSGFFMAIATGDIRVGSGVSHPGGSEPELEGIFVSERNFVSEAGASQLSVRGMVNAYGRVILGRDLGDGNVDAPAEAFEYAPDLLFNFPGSFNLKRTRWKEVTP